MLLFVDDANALVRNKDLKSSIEQTQTVFDLISNWCSQNELSLNVNKTECVIFRTSQFKEKFPATIDFNNTTVRTSLSTKFLGIHVDCFLNWYLHISELSKRLNRVLFMIRVLSRRVDNELLRSVYFANFESLMRYGVVIWGGSSDTSKIFILQKSALRSMLGLKFRESCRGRFRQNKILTFFGVYILECVIFLKKNPQYFDELCNRNSTRQMNAFHYPIHGLTLTEKNTQYMCIRLHNKIPKSIMNIISYGQFKRRLTDLIIEIEPYSISEFLNYSFEIS